MVKTEGAKKGEAEKIALSGRRKAFRIVSDQKTARINRIKISILIALAAGCVAAFLLVGLNFEKMKYVFYSLNIRVPKLVAMLLAAFAIGSASLVFQTIIGTRIVTPCLLGMNALYTMTHTAIVFIAGIGSVLVTNSNLSFAVDLVIMSVVATVIYGMIFKKTRHNILYILLIGTVIASLFSSIQNTLTMVMDPADYDALLATLVASFDNINTEIIIFSCVILAAIGLVLYRDCRMLDVIAMGKHQAINLGVDYDKSVRRLLLGVTLYIAVATAMVGPISFLGLIIANLAREFVKTYRHSALIAVSTLFGMIILVGGQMLVEQVFNFSVPVSVFITLFGGAYFLFLLLKQKKS